MPVSKGIVSIQLDDDMLKGPDIGSATRQRFIHGGDGYSCTSKSHPVSSVLGE